MYQLKSIEYDGVLVLSHYNEPLADRKILEYIKTARDYLPAASIKLYSNGDYLTSAYLEELAEAGLSSLTLSIHLAEKEPYSEEKIIARINEMSRRLGIEVEAKLYDPQRSIGVVFPHPRIEIMMFQADYQNIGVNRGGLLPDIQASPRISPCHSPFRTMTIAYNGQIMPCCHLRADFDAHNPYRIGHIDAFPTIFAAFAESKLIEWRRTLHNYGAKPAPCDFCQANIVEPTAESRALKNREAEFFGIAPLPSLAQPDQAGA